MERTVLFAGYYGFGNTGDEAILSALRRPAWPSGCPPRESSWSRAILGSTRQRHGVEAVFWRDPALDRRGGPTKRPRRHRRRRALSGLRGPRSRHAADSPPRRRHVLRGTGDPRGRRRKALLPARPRIRTPRSRMSRGASCAPWREGPPASPCATRRRGRCSPRSAWPRTRSPSRRTPRFSCRPSAFGPKTSSSAWASSRARRSSAWRCGPGGGASSRRPGKAAVAAALDTFIERSGGTLLFVPFEKSPWTEDDDFALASRVRRRLARADRAAILSGLLAPQDTASLLAGCDLVLAMRLHAAIFALAGGVPTVAIGYDPKVGALLAKAGLSDSLEPIAATLGREPRRTARACARRAGPAGASGVPRWTRNGGARPRTSTRWRPWSNALRATRRRSRRDARSLRPGAVREPAAHARALGRGRHAAGRPPAHRPSTGRARGAR